MDVSCVHSGWPARTNKMGSKRRLELILTLRSGSSSRYVVEAGHASLLASAAGGLRCASTCLRDPVNQFSDTLAAGTRDSAAGSGQAPDSPLSCPRKRVSRRIDTLVGGDWNSAVVNIIVKLTGGCNPELVYPASIPKNREIFSTFSRRLRQ